MPILLDSNVALDLFNDDPVWASWSEHQIEAAKMRDGLAVNPVIYAELSVGFARREDLDGALAALPAETIEIPRDALFLAGRAFVAYRRRGGTRTGVLPDFFIGAHAAVRGWQLLTRDPARYRAYFPTVHLIHPG